MKPAPFELFLPESGEEVTRLLAEHGEEARVLAGGQSLVPLMNMRILQPAVVVGLGRCAGLDYLRCEDGEIACGALCRQAALLGSEAAARAAPLLGAALAHVGVPASRSFGTVCGSLAHADPSAELPAAAAALGARFLVEGPRGTREVGADEFFVSALTTCLEPDEWLREVRFPAPAPGERHCFLEVANRAHGSAVAGLAATLELAADGRCARARLAAVGVGTPGFRLAAAEAALAGRRLDAAAIEEAGVAAEAYLDPDGDLHASAGYRRHLVGVLVRRALARIAAAPGSEER